MLCLQQSAAVLRLRIAYVEVYDCMTTELFEDEQGQAVRIPEACRFKGQEVVIGKVDELVVLAPKDSKWASFLETFAMLSNEDF